MPTINVNRIHVEEMNSTLRTCFNAGTNSVNFVINRQIAKLSTCKIEISIIRTVPGHRMQKLLELEDYNPVYTGPLIRIRKLD